MVFRTDMINMVKVTPEQENTNLNQMKKVYLTPQNSKKQVRRKESPQVEPKTKKYAVVFNDVAVSLNLISLAIVAYSTWEFLVARRRYDPWGSKPQPKVSSAS